MYSNIHLQNLNQMISFSNGNIIKVVDDFIIKSEPESIFYNNNISESIIKQILDIYLVSFNHYLNSINLILDSSFDIIDSLDDNDIYNISENCNNIIFVLQKSNEGYIKFLKWCVEKEITINENYINQNRLLVHELSNCKDIVSTFENYKSLMKLNKKDDKFKDIENLIELYENKSFSYPLINFVSNLKNDIMNFLFQEE
tara:strand:- start:2316 stop:2915 length:600 start_codon:yes stop_codon:yes gene_type:complete